MTKAQKQALFEKAVTGLLKQDGPSLTVYDACVYFAEDGRRCAVGHILPQSRWKSKIVRDGNNSGCGAGTLFETYPGLKKLLNVRTQADMSFLRGVQYALHDSYADIGRSGITEMVGYGGWHKWVRAKAIGFAARHKLTTKFLR